MNVIKKYIEKNKKLRTVEIMMLVLILCVSLISFYTGIRQMNDVPEDLKYSGTVMLKRDDTDEDYDEDSASCDVIYTDGTNRLIRTMTYDEYLKLGHEDIEGYIYHSERKDMSLLFDHPDPLKQQIEGVYRQVSAERLMPVFNLGNALIILGISLLVIMLFSDFFSTYEKVWFMTIMTLATIFAVLFPEESANGVNGIIIMLLYLLDTFLNILCELLISKQSRYNFLVSVLVEITEIVMSLVLMYRFATMTVTLFFWLPIDIISFINWSRHKDEQEDELTVVRRLKGYQEVLVVIAIIIWTIVVGYFISGLNIRTDFISNEHLETLIIYLDACASAVGIANGLFIFFRLREQWLAWYICSFLEAIINILTGQYVLLILKLGYFTNTTYGYIKWSRYIKMRNIEDNSLF